MDGEDIVSKDAVPLEYHCGVIVVVSLPRLEAGETFFEYRYRLLGGGTGVRGFGFVK